MAQDLTPKDFDIIPLKRRITDGDEFVAEMGMGDSFGGI